MLIGKLKKLILFGSDLILLYLALYLTLVIRYREFPLAANVWSQHIMPFTLLFGVWILIFYINGLYDIAASKNDIEFYNKIWRNLLVNFAIAAAYFYFLTDRLFDIKPRVVFFIFLGVYTLLFFIWRFWYNSLLRGKKFLKNVAVVGMNDEAIELIKEIIRKPQLGYRIAAIIHDGYDKNEFPGVTVYDSSTDIKKLLETHHARTVVTVLNPHANPQLVQQLYESLSLKLEFHDLPTFYEKLTGKIPVTTIGQIWFLENLTESEKAFYEIIKRIFDIVIAAGVLAISIPFLPVLALVIKLDSPGPVFFKQERAGAFSKTFLAIKFRSMVQEAEKEGQPQWAQKNDPRVTRFGRFMRKTRIDEIPQLLNVLRGEMSLVGPRPERPELVKNLQEIIPFYNERHLIKPGLTGWAQINFQYGASAGDALKKLQYDLFYVKNRSLPLDIGILLKTINLMLSGRGQ